MGFKINQQVVCTGYRSDWCQSSDLSIWQKLGLASKSSNGPDLDEIVTVEQYDSRGIHMRLKEYPEIINGKRMAFDEAFFEPLMDITELEEIINTQTTEA